MNSSNQNNRTHYGSNTNRPGSTGRTPTRNTQPYTNSASRQTQPNQTSYSSATRNLNTSSHQSRSSSLQTNGTRVSQRPTSNTYGSRQAIQRTPQQPNSNTSQYSRQQHSHSSGTRSSRKRKNTAFKKVLLIVFAIVFVVAAFCVVDTILYKSKIRNGVSVGGISVGGMSVTEASQLLMDSLNGTLSDAEINMYEDDASLQAGAASGGVNSGNFDYSQYNGWYTTADALGAHYDSGVMAEEAYEVGRGWDILGKFSALFHLASIPLTISYNEDSYESLVGDINATLGTETVDADIEYNGKQFDVVSGNDGYLLNDDDFKNKLATALTTEDHDFVLSMQTETQVINAQNAQNTADYLNESIGGKATCSYEQDSCSISEATFCSLIDTKINDEEDEPELLAYIDSENLKQYLKDNLIHDKVIGYEARDAQLYVYDGTVTVIPQLNGEGIDYKQAAEDLYDYFTSNPDETLDYALTTTELYPDVTTEDVEAMNISEPFSSYTTSYNPWNTNSVINVRLLADTLNGTLVAPGETFSILQTSGNCNEEKGYRMAAAYFEGEQIMEAGGGICQVATTLFNAVYNAGYPIVERSSHYYYVKAYPDGLDAAISWPDVDFKFKNDTDNWIMIAFAYDDFSVTCTLWGVDPEYEVESVSNPPWDETAFEITEILVSEDREIDDELLEKFSITGVNGHSIEVNRTVRKNGVLRSNQTFISRYAAKTQVDLVKEFTGKATNKYWLKEDNTIEEYDNQDKKEEEEATTTAEGETTETSATS